MKKSVSCDKKFLKEFCQTSIFGYTIEKLYKEEEEEDENKEIWINLFYKFEN